jgi:hypothetical protein
MHSLSLEKNRKEQALRNPLDQFRRFDPSFKPNPDTDILFMLTLHKNMTSVL